MRVSRWLMLLGFAFHAAFVTGRTAQLGHAPVATGLDSAALFLGFAAAVFLVLESWYGQASLGAVLAPALALFWGAAVLTCGREPIPLDRLSRVWLPLHLTPVVLAYASLGMALACAGTYLFLDRVLKRRDESRLAETLPSLETLDRLMRALVAAALPLLTLGLLVGFVWVRAQPAALDAAWYENAKILTACVLWLGCLALVHLRAAAVVRGRRAAWSVVLLCALAAATFAVGHELEVEGRPTRNEVLRP